MIGVGFRTEQSGTTTASNSDDKDGNDEHDLGDDEVSKRCYFSFDATQPTRIEWDPEIGMLLVA